MKNEAENGLNYLYMGQEIKAKSSFLAWITQDLVLSEGCIRKFK
jgi:hypothetical protein